MCDGCRQTSMDHILDIVLVGQPLVAAIRLWRDMAVQMLLTDPTMNYDDIVKGSDDVTEAGYMLIEMERDYPAQYATRLLLRAYEKKAT